MHWLFGKKSKLSVATKVVLYKAIIKPIWTYGLQLWGSSKRSNLEIIDRCQTKIIRAILGAPRYVRNSILLRDLEINNVATEAGNVSAKYKKRLAKHPNKTARQILVAKRYNRLNRLDPLQLDEAQPS